MVPESKKSHRRLISRTSTLPNQNEYTLALDRELSHVAFSEERAGQWKGLWQREIFRASQHVGDVNRLARPLDLEIGTGNGTFFAAQAKRFPERDLIGIELKYKPLIQTIRRALRDGAENAIVIRYHAFNIEDLFEPNELNDIYIHFPDPWVAPRKPKNRVVGQPILDSLFKMQKSGSALNFKTDSREYFLWAMDEIRKTKYLIEFETMNLHQSLWREKNFETAFEKIFLKKNIEINFVRLIKP
ncbi:MAG: tRNA (guanine-N7)-methyltransferase [Bdellovibrionaceae bacterium]|nr:tRNA (guanine-N7)-methyltransferase [Pseudobdellovibrionaceae bacterium]